MSGMVEISPPTMFKHHLGITPLSSGSRVWYGMLVCVWSPRISPRSSV